MKKMINTLTVASVVAFSANALYAWGGPGSGGRGYGNQYWNMGPHWFGGFYGGGIAMVIVTLVLLGFLLFFGIKYFQNRGLYIGKDEAPLDVLKKRYAKGEITKEQFDAMKKELAG